MEPPDEECPLYLAGETRIAGEAKNDLVVLWESLGTLMVSFVERLPFLGGFNTVAPCYNSDSL